MTRTCTQPVKVARTSRAQHGLRVALVFVISSVLIACGGATETMSSGGGGIGGTCISGTIATQLLWDSVGGAASYRVYVGTSPGMYGQGVDVGLVTSASVPGLSPATTYYFAVTAYDGTNESSYSNEVCKTTT